MPDAKSGPQTCSIASALDLLGDRWTILIVRDAMFGVRHFEEFQQRLGIARNVLSARLARLVAEGILSRRRDPADGRRLQYRLTDKGRDLLPVLLALRQWGERWHFDGAPMPTLKDRATGRPIAGVKVMSADGRALEYGQIESRDPLGLRQN